MYSPFRHRDTAKQTETNFPANIQKHSSIRSPQTNRTILDTKNTIKINLIKYLAKSLVKPKHRIARSKQSLSLWP